MTSYMKTLLRSDTAAARAGRPFYRDPRFLVLFTVTAIAMDSCSLFSTLDSVFKGSILLVLPLTVGISMILNVLPSLLPCVIRTGMSLVPKIAICLVILLVISLLFCFTFTLRMASAEVAQAAAENDSGIDITAPDGTDLNPTPDPVTNPKAEEAARNVQKLAGLLIGLEPLLTSAACLILSCVCDNRPARYIKLKKQEVLLSNAAMDLECQIQQLEAVSIVGALEREAETRFLNAKKADACHLAKCHIMARNILACHQRTARALSFLTHKA